MKERQIYGNGIVPDGWRRVRLDEVADVMGGSTPSRKREDFWGGHIPWVVPSELTNLTGRYLKSTNEAITDAGMKSAGLKLIPAGSVLLTSRATVGVTAINACPMVTNQGFQSLVAKDGTDSLWLYHNISSTRSELERRAAGSTFLEVSRDNVRSLPILFPPLSEQQAIAAVLDAMDGAIESADAAIAASEVLRDALLQALLTRGMPGWHSKWKTAPGFGSIPADWDVALLGEVTEIAFSGVDKKSLDGEAPVLLCNYTDVFYHRRITPDMAFMMATASAKEKDRWNLKRGDVLFTKDSETPDELGIPSVVVEDMPDVLCGYHLGIARPSSKILDGSYLAEALRSSACKRQFARVANGVTRFGLTLEATRAIQVLVPTPTEQRAITSLLESVDRQLEQARNEHEDLKAAKTTLADTLLSGRMRIGKKGPAASTPIRAE